MKRAHVTNNVTPHNLAKNQCHRLVGAVKPVGWDQRRFAAPVHHEFSMFPDGGPALEASWSHPTLKEVIARLTKAKRRGFTLIELMVVIAIISVIFSLVGAVFQRLFLSEQSAMRAALIEQTVSRLADQFRRDIHAATFAEVDTHREGATGSLGLFEANRDQPAIVYVILTDEVRRERRAADSSVSHREVYRLPECRIAFAVQVAEAEVSFLSLSIARQHSTITPQPQASRPYRTLVVEAALGRDNRLTTSLKPKLPAATQEESK